MAIRDFNAGGAVIRSLQFTDPEAIAYQVFEDSIPQF
jgi:hypothetical protein